MTQQTRRAGSRGIQCLNLRHFLVGSNGITALDKRGRSDRRRDFDSRSRTENSEWDMPPRDAMLIRGRHPVLEALRKGIVQEVEILVSAHGPAITQIEAEAARASIPCVRRQSRTPEEGDYLQGVRAYIRPVEARHDLLEFIETLNTGDSPLLLMLDGIEDPHNFGAILRSAYASGVAGIVIRSRRQAPLTDTVFKTSAGAAALIPIFEVPNLEQLVRALKPLGWWAVAAQMGESATDYHDLDWQRATILIVGAEGKGVSDLLRKRSDDLVSIPMPGGIDSLNASVAAGVLLFEAAYARSKRRK
jgi:23S rRNA (guanosine2251-2'-O)-methyltransferase